MLFRINKHIVNDCPFITVNNTGIRQQSKKKMVIIFHKMLENKETQLPLAYKMAKQGYYCVLPDMHGHGERLDGFDSIQRYDFNCIYEDIYKTALNVPLMVDFIKNKEKDIMFAEVCGIGISIGASVALLSSCFTNMKCVVSIIGIPCCWAKQIHENIFDSYKMFSNTKGFIDIQKLLKDAQKYDPLNFLKNSSELPYILMINGKMDIAMPLKIVRQAYDHLAAEYENQLERLSQKLIPRAGHFFTENMQSITIEYVNQIFA